MIYLLVIITNEGCYLYDNKRTIFLLAYTYIQIFSVGYCKALVSENYLLKNKALVSENNL